VIETTLAPYRQIDWKILMMLKQDGTDAKANIAMAFRELAEKAGSINNLNITPDLLQSLTGRDPAK
jgi:hypothetical protein